MRDESRRCLIHSSSLIPHPFPPEAHMDFHLPQLGEGVYEAEMFRWLVGAGDAVKHGQGLMEVLTDKATMEVPAPFAGTVTELRVQPGSTIRVGDHVLTY